MRRGARIHGAVAMAGQLLDRVEHARVRAGALEVLDQLHHRPLVRRAHAVGQLVLVYDVRVGRDLEQVGNPAPRRASAIRFSSTRCQRAQLAGRSAAGGPVCWSSSRLVSRSRNSQPSLPRRYLKSTSPAGRSTIPGSTSCGCGVLTPRLSEYRAGCAGCPLVTSQAPPRIISARLPGVGILTAVGITRRRRRPPDDVLHQSRVRGPRDDPARAPPRRRPGPAGRHRRGRGASPPLPRAAGRAPAPGRPGDRRRAARTAATS